MRGIFFQPLSRPLSLPRKRRRRRAQRPAQLRDVQRFPKAVVPRHVEHVTPARHQDRQIAENGRQLSHGGMGQDHLVPGHISIQPGGKLGGFLGFCHAAAICEEDNGVPPAAGGGVE